MIEEELTPIEQSRAATGKRFFRVEPSTYDELAAGVDLIRGYPHGVGTPAVTLRGLPSREEAVTDEEGWVLIGIDVKRFTPADEEMMEPAVEAGLVVEMTREAWQAAKVEP